MDSNGKEGRDRYSKGSEVKGMGLWRVGKSLTEVRKDLRGESE